MKELSYTKAAIAVVSVHFILILWMVFYQDPVVPYKPRERLTVQTVTLSTKAEPIAMTLPEIPKPATVDKPKLNPTPTIKKTEPTRKVEPERKKEPPPQKTQPAPKQQTVSVDPRKKELLAKAQESIAKIQQNRATFKADVSGAENSPPGYRDELVARLQMMLRLPERGDVRIKLILAKNGKFVKMEILSSQSTVNKKYVEKSLPSIQFPPFGKEFGNASESSFNITLSSEI